MNFRKIGLTVLAAFAISAVYAPNVFAFVIGTDIEGYWWQADNSRRGWAFQYLDTGSESGVLFVTGFTFDDEGNQLWLSGNTTIVDGQYDVDIELLEVTGGIFGPGQGTPTQEVWGNLNVVFNSCSSADFSFTSPNITDFDAEFTQIRSITGGTNEGICVYQNEFNGCPAFATPAALDRTCVLQGTYTQDITLTNDTYWVLSGGVLIGNKAEIGDPVPTDGPTLYIEAGTRIIGSGGAGNALYIQRGSRIVSVGQPNAPVVMTGPFTASEGAGPSDWGGLVINGAAPINTCDAGVCEALGEGDSGAYGGDNPQDNSGIMKYTRVQYAGELINDEDELNGIAFQGVGNGTTVDYVQVHGTADDCIEFFGGTVNVKHMVVSDCQDDSIDWTQGWTGNMQFVLVQQSQDPTYDTDRGMELDNLEQNFEAMPRSMPTMANVTLIGKNGELGANPRRGTGGRFSNFIWTGFSSCINIDDDATFNAAGAPPFPAGLTGVLTIENTIVNCPTNFVEEPTDPWSTQVYFDSQTGNMEMNPMLNGAVPPEGASYTQGFPLDPDVYGEFFDHVDYIGAVRSADSAWYYNWTDFYNW